ncbi:MAG: acetyl-CoA carboxylase biotin carboxyl carrier protein subunit [Thermoleophilia bacterium]|nr:acetyl-CoA carboxylase biotin carboxyl carrier protein subunit [Thermoleophilia bacterium]
MPQYVLNHGSEEIAAEVVALREGVYRVSVADRDYEVDARLLEQSVCSLIVDGDCYEVHFARQGLDYTLLIGGEHYEVSARNRRVRAAYTGGAKLAAGRQVIAAPMPGRVVKVVAGVGDQVQAGAPILVLEAMKMENQLRSPIDGTMAEVLVTAGQVVATGEKLAVVE